MNQIAKEAAQKIIWDLTCRKGLKHEWDCIDKEIQEEIEEAWTKIIVEQFSNRIEHFVIKESDPQRTVLLAEIEKLKQRNITEDKRIYDEALQQVIEVCDKYINIAKIKDLNEFQDGAISCAKAIKSELQKISKQSN